MKIQVLIAQDSTSLWVDEERMEGEFDNMQSDLWDRASLNQKGFDLNRASELDLYQSGLFSQEQILEVLVFRKEYGDFIELDELKVLSSFSNKDIDQLRNVLVVKKSEDEFQTQPHATFLIRYSGKDILNSSRSDWSELYRLRIGSSAFDFSLVLERDSQEKWISQKGVEYLAIGVKAKITKNWNIVLGDFGVNFGQGLHFFKSYSMGRSVVLNGIQKVAKPVFNYTSTDEVRGLRGVASVYQNNRWQWLSFYSNRLNDFSPTSIDEGRVAYSISGYHKTPNEILRKHNGKEIVVGNRLQYSFLHLGVGLGQSYNLIKINSGEEFSFLTHSIDVSYQKRNLTFVSEMVFQDSCYSSLFGSSYKLGNTKLFAFYRDYALDIVSNHSNALGKRAKNKDETGILFGINSSLANDLLFRSYLDFYSFHDSQGFIDGENGVDYFSLVEYHLSSSVLIGLRFNKNYSQGFRTFDSEFSTQNTNRYRVQFSYEPYYRFHFKTTFEVSQSSLIPHSKGYFIQENLSYAFQVIPLSINLFVSFAQLDDYEQRFFVYEPTIRYGFGMRQVSQAGWNTGFVCNLKLGKNIRIYFKSRFDFTDSDVINNQHSIQLIHEI